MGNRKKLKAYKKKLKATSPATYRTTWGVIGPMIAAEIEKGVKADDAITLAVDKLRRRTMLTKRARRA